MKFAPKTGLLVIAFTDVQSSTKLWQKNPREMEKALKIHNSVMRKLIARYHGFEVKTQGDSFMVAFSSPEDALNWACSVQLALLDEDWSTQLVSMYDCRVQFDKYRRLIFRGPRVRIGLHFGEAQRIIDPVTRRPDYFGTTVNKAARCEGEAKGGQILITEEFFHEVSKMLHFPDEETSTDSNNDSSSGGSTQNSSGKRKNKSRKLLYSRTLSDEESSAIETNQDERICCKILGSFALKGLAEKAVLYEVAPSSLKYRTFDVTKEQEEVGDGQQHFLKVSSKTSLNQVVPVQNAGDESKGDYIVEFTPKSSIEDSPSAEQV